MTYLSSRISIKSELGFSVTELMIAITILGIMMAVGLPSLFSWLNATRAKSLTEFYIEGMRLAREGAIKHNGASRLVLSTNTTNGQFDWQVDWCSPISTSACDESGVWSTTKSAVSTVAGQPSGFSVFRSADGLPASTLIAPSTNSQTTEVYFTSVGWINTNVEKKTNIRALLFTPSSTEILPEQIVITLSGIAERCNPTATAPDSRACP
jgi:type IV fimbrial biogenesis protein FimT